MNFDELQKQWQNEEVSAPEISLDHQHKINNPLEKIRRNMKMEFWYSIVSYVLIIAVFFPFIIKNEDRFIIIFLILLGIGITAYYFAKFFKLYQIISKPFLTGIVLSYPLKAQSLKDAFTSRYRLLIRSCLFSGHAMPLFVP